VGCAPVSAVKGHRKAMALASRPAKCLRTVKDKMCCDLGDIKVTHAKCRDASYICTKASGDKPKHVVCLTGRDSSDYENIINETAAKMAAENLTKDDAYKYAKARAGR